jgi:hypothetical protein
MTVYSDRKQTVNTGTLIGQILAAADPLERLILLGQLEAGAVDALCPHEDHLHPVAAELRDISTGDAPLERLRSLALPSSVSISTPEGYAYYSLYPLQYDRAAQRFAREHRPTQCIVLGIRSIGTSLSAVVTKALRAAGTMVWSWTVRPHGHPFDRCARLSPALTETMRRAEDAWFCIVDEGPGLSGSSFASVADALSATGVDDRKIVFFPSHEPDATSFVSDKARDRWLRHKNFVEPFPLSSAIPTGARELSGGLWREVTGCDVAVQPQHERRKYLHDGKLWKFAGLAHLGRARFERGQVLSDAGLIPRVLEFHEGFITSEFVPQRMCPHDVLNAVTRYLVFIRREFETGQSVRYAEMRDMIHVNTGIEVSTQNSLIEDAGVIAIDGRMLPHEWVGAFKTDALDHYDDHFFPGCQDIAWDIAGAAVEFGIPVSAIADRYLASQYDPALRNRLPFYRTAYLAYRIGYAGMAATSLGSSPDGRRFAALKQRYTAALLGTVRPASSSA